MAGYNKIIMVGNLTRDPELRAVGSSSICKMTIASNRSYKNRQTGATTQEVCFIDIEVWGTQADVCKMYLQKGKPILVEGRLKLDSWKDTEGNTKSKHSIYSEKIVFLSSSDNQNDNIEDNNSLIQETEFNSKQSAAIDEIKTIKTASLAKDKQASRKTNNQSFQDIDPFYENEEKQLPF